MNKYTETSDKISNHHQLGGIETSVLDNGKGKGTRIAWVNTGSGFRYKVVLDRCMDIADAFFGKHNLAWISHAGTVASPNRAGYGREWLDKFGGGLLTTCGLSNVGPAEDTDNGPVGFHGDITFEPAEIISIIQPNLSDDEPFMSITGLVKETSSFGKHLEMKRTISSVLGEASLTIRDEITNKSNSPLPLMLMYHCNFGYPLVDAGARLCWDGKWRPRSDSLSDTYIFNNTNDFKKCREPLDATEEFNGEACAFISPAADSAGVCRASIINEKINVAVELLFDKQELPYLTNWQHYKRGEYVIGLEPGTNPPMGQSSAKAENELVYLEPNETKRFNLEIVLHDNNDDLLLY